MIYHIQGFPHAWIFPALALGGLLFLLFSLILKRRWPLFLAVPLFTAGALGDSDLSLLAACMLVALLLMWAYRGI